MYKAQKLKLYDLFTNVVPYIGLHWSGGSKVKFRVLKSNSCSSALQWTYVFKPSLSVRIVVFPTTHKSFSNSYTGVAWFYYYCCTLTVEQQIEQSGSHIALNRTLCVPCRFVWKTPGPLTGFFLNIAMLFLAVDIISWAGLYTVVDGIRTCQLLVVVMECFWQVIGNNYKLSLMKKVGLVELISARFLLL